MPVVAYALVVFHILHFMIDRRCKAQIITRVIHHRPLERREWLRDKEGCRYGDTALSVSFLLGNLIVLLRDLLRQMGDILPVLLRLCRLAEHEIELHLVPSASESLPCTMKNILLRQALVDDIPKPLRSCFRSESQRALADILHLAHHIKRECIDSQGRERDVDLPLPVLPDQVIHQLREAGIIAR